jgi:predicted RNase H-like HicB family nuclease
MKSSNKIIVRNNRIVGVELNVKFYYDNNCSEVVARFEPLMITTSGKDLSHAKEMFKESFELCLETVNEDGNAREVLENLGWKFKKIEAIFTNKHETFGLPFLADNSFRLNIPSIVWAN